MTAATMELSDRVRTFDTGIGSDLEGGGVLSRTNHEILRGLLGEAGYECVYSRGRQKIGVYPMNERNVYARPSDGHIDVFVEENLGNEGKVGFSHLRLGMGRYMGFMEDYKKITTATNKYLALSLVGAAIVLLGVSEMTDHHTLGSGMVLFGAGNIILAAYLAFRRERKARKRVTSLQPETNPQRAIQKALGI